MSQPRQPKHIYTQPTWEVTDSTYDVPIGTLFKTTMTYNPHDPYVLTLNFQSRGCAAHPSGLCSCSDSWEFARDLFIHGLNMPSGVGDVMFEPRVINGTTYLNMTIGHGEHIISAITPRTRMYAFMLRMIRLVPIGRESSFMDIDSDIAKIFEEEERIR